jgi:hypothetical protein
MSGSELYLFGAAALACAGVVGVILWLITRDKFQSEKERVEDLTISSAPDPTTVQG